MTIIIIIIINPLFIWTIYLHLKDKSTEKK